LSAPWRTHKIALLSPALRNGDAIAASLHIRIVDTLAAIDPAAWNSLAGDDPFLRHEFFSALHDTGCACTKSGWTPRFITLWDGGVLRGALPLYIKMHSYGEYVFDWAWADAYQRHRLDYYPKLLSAVPFSPVAGQRAIAATSAERAMLVRAAIEMARQFDLSSLHILFPPAALAEELRAEGMMIRQGVQFHWHNAGYASFDDFLAGMSHAKRKNIRQERRKVAERGIAFRWLSGREAQTADWRFFVRCYDET
jgi:predicted N-acyltransferase